MQTDSSFTVAEGRRHGIGSLQEYTISCGGYDVSCTSFAEKELPDASEMVVSLARLNMERLELYRRLGCWNDHGHTATCCEVLATIASDADMQEKSLMLEGCSCVFCASVLEVIRASAKRSR